MQGKRILIIDDDIDLSKMIMDLLTNYGYSVQHAKDSDVAFEILKKESFHLILLDINLPDLSGFEICQELRRVSTVPVIFASARTDENDRIHGLDIGGDDYLAKPYSLKELLSRVNALIRRTYGYQESEDTIEFDNITINFTSRTVTRDKQPVSLSLREFDLLAYLVKYKNVALDKERLLTQVWGTFHEVEPSTLTVHIRWLREKLEKDPANPVHIKTVWGKGYLMEL